MGDGVNYSQSERLEERILDLIMHDDPSDAEKALKAALERVQRGRKAYERELGN